MCNPDFEDNRDELINRTAEQFAAYLKDYDFDGLDEITEESFTEWFISKTQDGFYEEELTDLIVRAHTWVSMHAIEVATDYAEYLIDLGEA